VEAPQATWVVVEAVVATLTQATQVVAALLAKVSKADIMCTLVLILVAVVVVPAEKAWRAVPARDLALAAQALVVILPEHQYSTVAVAEQHNITLLVLQLAELVAEVLAFMQVLGYRALLIQVAAAEQAVATELVALAVLAVRALLLFVIDIINLGNIMSLPFEFSWGVAEAVKKLRPGATFELIGIQLTNWNDPTGKLAPTWDEINLEMEKLHAEIVKK
jgi:hypothetical protein